MKSCEKCKYGIRDNYNKIKCIKNKEHKSENDLCEKFKRREK